ncbi:MAG: tetratricopeptide repeat protein [Chloroherpetonaceae bacterium]|nr:tetratricopeptide repeat protein [Chloroherpetonaceae bacterium]MDW8436766.1 tetratricopeptide repeat protein [Chloroherpetonaceae bacterium]
MSSKFIRLVLAVVVLFSLSAADGGCGNSDVESAKLYLRQGNSDDALNAARNATITDPTNGEAYYLLGKAYYVKQKNDSAAIALKKALEPGMKISEADLKDAKALLGEVWRLEYNAGASLFNQAYTEKSDESLKRDLLNQAVAKLNSAIAIQPDSSASYRALANSQVLLKDFRAAVQTLEKAIQIAETDTGYYVQLSNIYASEIKDTARAIATLETAYQKNLRSPEVVRLLATNYFLAKRYNAAETMIKQALQSDPNNLLMLFLYGTLLNERKEYNAAIEQFKKVIEINPSYLDYACSYNAAVSYFKLAEADEEANKPKDKKRGKKAPEYTGHYRFYEEAIKILKPAAEASNNKDFWRFLGQLYARVGKNAEATEALAKAK